VLDWGLSFDHEGWEFIYGYKLLVGLYRSNEAKIWAIEKALVGKGNWDKFR
jgi:hypothetical protein